jgi:hypothetical protein
MSVKAILQSWESEIVIVFAVLIGATILYKLIAIFISVIKKNNIETKQEASEAPHTIASLFSGGQVKLIDVDEKTAATIIAIVSHETGIPLSELQFKSIKALNN